MLTTDARLLDELTNIASRAGASIQAIAHRALDPRRKADKSVVTAADEAAEAVILESLSRLLPGIPIVSEEAAAQGKCPTLAREFILVDPLDGTRDFLDGRPEFTVNIAIVADQTPVLGVVGAPALNLIWRGAVGHGAERLHLKPGASMSDARDKTAIKARPAPAAGLAVTHSRSHLDPATAAFVEKLPKTDPIVCGSAIKFCRVAEGTADVYPRLSPTCEWDVAAGNAVLAAAGGIVTTPQAQPIIYGNAQAKFVIPAFLAWGDRAAAERFKL